MTPPTPQPASHQRGNKRIITIAVVLGLLTVQGILVAAFLQLDKDRQEHQVIRFPSRALHPTPTRDNPTLTAPKLELQPLQGPPVSLRSITSKGPTLVHFWATWDPKSRQSLPILAQFLERYNVQLVAVAVDASWGQVAGITEQPIPTWVMLPHTPTYVQDFQLQALPETWLLDSQNRAVIRWKGHHTWQSDVAKDELAVQIRKARLEAK